MQLTYGGGGKCTDPIAQVYSVTFRFECDPKASDGSPQAALQGVDLTRPCT